MDKIIELGNLFAFLHQSGNGAVIGAGRGDSAAQFKKFWSEGNIHLIDRWNAGPVDIYNSSADKREAINNYLFAVNRFAEDELICIYRMTGEQALHHFENEYFEWIYFNDADFSERDEANLVKWVSKLKSGGMFCFDIDAKKYKSGIEKITDSINSPLFKVSAGGMNLFCFVNSPGFDISKAIQNTLPEGRVLNDNEIAGLLQKAEELIENGNYLESQVLLKKILDANPMNVDALNDLSVIEILDGNLSSAELLIKTILKINPSDEIALGNYQYLKEQMEGK